MALNKALTELLDQIKDANDRATMQAQFEKYDFFQPRFEAGLRQEDYDRNMNKLKQDRETEQTLVEGYKKSAEEWKTWAANNVPKHTDLLKNYTELETKYKSLEDEKSALVLAAASGSGEGENKVDPKVLLAQVNAEIEKRGFVPKSDMQALVAAETDKMVKAERESFYKTTVPALYNEFATMNDLQFKHRDEFGEKLNPQEFSKFRSEKGINDPNDAYSQFTAEKRQAKLVSEIEKTTREKVEREWASKINLPGSGAPSAPELGPVQERVMGHKSGLNLEKPGYLEAAEALRAEGRF